MGGRYDIMQRIKEVLEASDPLKYGDAEQARSIEVGPPPELSPDPRVAALSNPLLPSIEPPPPLAMSPPPVVAPPPPVNVPPQPVAAVAQGQAELVQLLREGRKIMAVKRYRELTGVGLAEAKAAVDDLEQRIAAGDHAALPSATEAIAPRDRDALTAEVAALVQGGNKIEAIKVYREAASVGLREAKEAVDAIEMRLRQERASGAASQTSPFAVPPAPPAARRGGRPMPAWMQPVVDQLNRGNKIGAIKAYRDATGVGLAEAKATVEALERQLANEGR